MLRRPLAALAAIALLLTAFGSAATAEATASVDSLDITEADGILTVDGTVSAAGDTFVAATNPPGRSNVPGADLVELSITPSSLGTLDFAMTVSNAPPVVFTTPGVLHYIWTFVADGVEYQFRALNTDANGTGLPGTWSYTLDNCAPDPDTGQGSCARSGIPVEGSSVDGVVTFSVASDDLGVGAGDRISSGAGGAYISYGAAGLVWGAGGVLLASQASPRAYTIPTATIVVDTLDVDGSVLQSATTTATGLGGFTDAVTLDAAGVDAVRGTVTYDGATGSLTVER